jgi:hypothetical protein
MKFVCDQHSQSNFIEPCFLEFDHFCRSFDSKFHLIIFTNQFSFESERESEKKS